MRFIGLMMILVVAGARADYVMPNPIVSMNNQTFSQVVNTTLSFTSYGTYTGHHSSGTACSVVVSTSASADLEINFPDLGPFDVYSPSTQNSKDINCRLVSMIVNNPAGNQVGSLQLFVETQPEEEPAEDLLVNIVGSNGVPSSVQLGVANAPNGGSGGFRPGQVIPSSLIQWFDPCSDLVKSH